MSFSWAVTDKTKQPVQKPDSFRGYFTDIQRAARRSLPKQPDKDLRQLLGLTLVPASDEKARAQTINNQIQERPRDVEKIQGQPAKADEKIPDVKPSKKTFVDRILSKLPCRTKRQEECTVREKIISSFAVYFVIVIFILLIVVIILSAAISAIGNEENDGNSSIDILSQGNLSTTKAPMGISVSSNMDGVKATSTSPSLMVPTEDTRGVVTTRNSDSNLSTLPKSTTISTWTPVRSLTSRNTVSSFRTRTETSLVTISRSKSTTPVSNISSRHSGLPTVTSTTTRAIETFTTEKTVDSTKAISNNSSTVKPITTTTTGITVSNAPPSFTNSTITQSASSMSTSITTTALQLPFLTRPVITCTTTSCLAARATLNRVSFSTSPCKDFYKFACGGWINNTEGQRSDVSQKNVPTTSRGKLRLVLLKRLQVLLQGVFYNTDSLTVRVSRRLYQACLESNMNGDTELSDVERHTSLFELGEIMSQLGMSPQGAVSATIDKLLLLSRSRFQITPFFKMSTIMLDDGNGGKIFGIEVSPPELYLGLENYKQPLETNNLAQLYITRVTEILYMYLTSFYSNGIPGVPGTRRKKSLRNRRQSDDIISLFAAEFEEPKIGISGISYEEVYFKVQQSYSIDLSIAKIIEQTKNSSLPKTNNTIVTSSRMKELFPNIDWDSALGARSTSALIKITNQEYLKSLDELFPNLNKDDLQLYIFLSVLIQRVWNYMPYPLRNMIRDININNAIYSETDCVEKTIELAHEETHALYIGQYTQAVLRNRLDTANLVNTITKAFQSLISQSERIMSDLQQVVSVFLSSTKLVFSPVKAYIRETEGIQGAQQSFLSLALELHRQKNGYESFLVTLAVDEDNIIRDWTSPELGFESTLNFLTIPTGISVYLTNTDQPNFELHGYLGFLLAEQLKKVLTGEMVNGVPPEWWGSENVNRFQPIKDCFTKQMSQQTLKELQFGVGKIIISSGAFEIIHEGFSRNTPFREQFIPNTMVTEEMLFYINTAQLECSIPTYSNHELQRFSVNNRISNSQRFAEIFGCPNYSPMVTEQQCLVFTKN